MRDVAGIRSSERELLADLAMPLGAITSLFLAAGLVPLRGDRWRPVILAILLMPVAGSALLGGARSGLATALVASSSFNFFHLPPYGLLKLGPQLSFVLLIILPVLVAVERRRHVVSQTSAGHRPDHDAERAPR